MTAPNIKMRKKRTTKRNTIETKRNTRAPQVSLPIGHYTIGEFAHDGEKEATEVHFLLFQKNNPIPISMRFTSPDTLGDLIEELDNSRSRVFNVPKLVSEAGADDRS